MVLILGGPRSGTTWLGKIFDSSPDVIYRHEPDAVLSCPDLPFILRDDEVGEHVERARSYLLALGRERSLRTVGKPPYFPKSFSTPFSHALRGRWISCLRLLSSLPGAGSLASGLKVPDMVSRSSETPTCVIKSVASLGRSRVYQRAMQDDPIVYIIRHPCGFVASELRGIASGKLRRSVALPGIASLPQAVRHGLSLERLQAMDLLEQLAWNWVLLNEFALEGLRNKENAMVLLHDDLGADPIRYSRQAFEFCGLPWRQQTERFLLESSSNQGDATYFGVARDSEKEISKWRDELSADEIQRVLNAASGTLPGNLFAS